MFRHSNTAANFTEIRRSPLDIAAAVSILAMVAMNLFVVANGMALAGFA